MKGEIFGRLTAMEEPAQGYVQCRCECGQVKRFYAANVRLGKSKSCGCLARETTGNRARTHGLSKTKEYMVWARMWARCTNPGVDRYPRYGGRGITVCERWKSFESFLADVGEMPGPNYSIGRIDNDANYEPGNVRWETRLEQANNTSTTVFLEHGGEKKPLQQLARELDIPAETLVQRVKAGMPPEKMFRKGNLTARPIVVDGVERLTTEWMQDVDIPISSFYHHRRKGMSDEEIVRLYLSRRLEKSALQSTRKEEA